MVESTPNKINQISAEITSTIKSMNITDLVCVVHFWHLSRTPILVQFPWISEERSWGRERGIQHAHEGAVFAQGWGYREGKIFLSAYLKKKKKLFSLNEILFVCFFFYFFAYKIGWRFSCQNLPQIIKNSGIQQIPIHPLKCTFLFRNWQNIKEHIISL